MFEPLLSGTARDEPEWKSWVAHVTLVTFCLQHEYRWPEDGRVCELLVDRYLAAFDAVPGYAGFHIYKHHAVKHLRKQLGLHGPFRQCWCFPQESLLRRLKQLTNMSNYICAPHSCLSLFAARRLLTLRDDTPECLITTSSAILNRSEMVDAGKRSKLMDATLCQPDHACVHAACFVKSFLHGTMRIELNSWILVTSREGRAVMQVSEITEMWSTKGSCIRLWCTGARTVAHIHQRGPRFSLATSAPTCAMLIRIELVSLTLLRCAVWEDQLIFRYAF